MSKISNITISLVSASLLFSGCGGGSSGGTDTPTTSVEVERGKVYDSNVVDATGKVATKTVGSNIYVFSGVPTYPITASGGWIDLDGDGEMTTSDIALDVNLTSYSNTVTPITTYIADTNPTIREQRLQELAQNLGTTTDNLLKVPSKGTKDTVIAANAIFKEMKTTPNTIPTTLSITDINGTLTSLKTTYNQSFTGETDMVILAKTFEQAVVNANSELFTKLTTTKIAQIEATRPQNTANEINTLQTYNIIDYLITTNTSRKSWDFYRIGLDDSVIDSFPNILSSTEFDMGDIKEIPTLGTFYIYDNYYTLNLSSSATHYPKEIKIENNFVANCKWTKHHNSLTLRNNKIFSDVLELTCPKYKFYFAKGQGNIAKIGITKDVRNESYDILINTITLKNLTIGEMVTNDNELLKLE